MKITEDHPFVFCNYCAKSINTKKSPYVCNNDTCTHFNEEVDKNGDLKNV